MAEQGWHLWYAWRPVRCTCGTWVWLRHVYRHWDEFANHWADSSGYSGYDGGWEYSIWE